MENLRFLLAKKQNFGSVYQCEKGCFHLQVGRVNLALSTTEYAELVDLVNSSAANFELIREDCDTDLPACN